MAGNADILKDTFRRATDGDLVHMAARRAAEQSVISQLSEVTVAQGMAQGIEFVLREPLPGELPEDYAGDDVLDALRDEIRHRIAQRFSTGEANG